MIFFLVNPRHRGGRMCVCVFLSVIHIGQRCYSYVVWDLPLIKGFYMFSVQNSFRAITSENSDWAWH